jgi:hypothetical protein
MLSVVTDKYRQTVLKLVNPLPFILIGITKLGSVKKKVGPTTMTAETIQCLVWIINYRGTPWMFFKLTKNILNLLQEIKNE